MTVTLFEFENDVYHPIPSLVIDNSESNLDPKHPVLAIHLCQGCGRPAPAEITQNYLSTLLDAPETDREDFAWCRACNNR